MTENWFGTEKVEMKNIVLMFDGGAKPNPGKGYGSYSFKEKGENWDIYLKIEEPYGDNITSPQAEYTAYYSYEDTLNQNEEVDEERFNKFVNLGISADDMYYMLNDKNLDKKRFTPLLISAFSIHSP